MVAWSIQPANRTTFLRYCWFFVMRDWDDGSQQRQDRSVFEEIRVARGYDVEKVENANTFLCKHQWPIPAYGHVGDSNASNHVLSRFFVPTCPKAGLFSQYV